AVICEKAETKMPQSWRHSLLKRLDDQMCFIKSSILLVPFCIAESMTLHPAPPTPIPLGSSMQNR
ncbi:hypothetical protein LZ012_16510, partial [Dechloromonas sp. XY25]